MTLKKDKEKVIDPVWDEQRIRDFLLLLPPQGENSDFHRLLKAYQSMRKEDFAQFIHFFIEAGHDIDAKNTSGESASDIIQQHRYGKEYLEIMNKYR